MTIQDWGAIGEMIGGLALLASLIYLAVQIRQNTRQISRSVEATQLEAFERSAESGNRFRELLILHPELAGLFLRGLEGTRDMDRAELFRFNMLLRNVFSEFHSAYVRHLAWTADPEAFVGQRVLDSMLANQGVREWVRSTDADWRPEFRRFVDKRLAAIEAGETPGASTGAA